MNNFTLTFVYNNTTLDLNFSEDEIKTISILSPEFKFKFKVFKALFGLAKKFVFEFISTILQGIFLLTVSQKTPNSEYDIHRDKVPFNDIE